MRTLRLHLLLLGLAASAQAQTSISLDGSLEPGAQTGPIAPLSPGVYEIPHTVGVSRGDNLFHSFGDFDIGVGDRATFVAQGEYERVIARVTGGEPSNIDGTLASTVMRDAANGVGADLYLLNPWGLLFGPSSSLDVPAGLYLSTAQQLHFEHGVVLDVTDSTPEVLSVEDPVAFGFLGGPPPNPALDFDIQFGNPQTPNFVGTRPGQTFSIVGRDISVRGRMFLSAQSGTLQVAALGEAAAQVPVDIADLETLSGNADQLGSVELSGRSQLSTLAFDAAADQGNIVIRAGRFAVAGAIVQAGGQGADGAAVDIETAGPVSIGANSTIATVNQGVQDAGSVRIRAGSVGLDGANAVIRSQVAGDGDGGSLEVDAGSITLRNNAQIETRSDSFTGPVSGAVGDITLIATQDVRVESGADVISRTATLGPGGDITIRAGQLAVVDAAVSAESSASAPGGSIAIDADRVEVRGGLSQLNTLSQMTAASGPTLPGGSIRIGSESDPATSVLVADGGLISTQAGIVTPTGGVGTQPGGSISIVSDSLEVTGVGFDSAGDPRSSALQTSTVSASETAAGGSIVLDLGLGSLRVGASEPGGVPGIVAAFVAEGARSAGGSIDIDAGSALVEDGGQVFTTTLGVGRAGSIDVDLTGDFVARGARLAEGFQPSGLFARGEDESAGDAGNIDVSARRIELLDAAGISSRADGSGDSGDIALLATEAIRVVGGFQASSVTARGLVGRAGNVTLAGPAVDGELTSVGQVELLDGGIVDVSVSGAGEGGLLRLVADELVISGESGTGIPSSLGAETAGDGDASGIEIEVSGLVRIERGGELNAISRGGGSAGGVLIEGARSVEVLDGGRVTVESQTNAEAGRIDIDVSQAGGRVLVARGGEINAISRGSGQAGDIDIRATSIEVSDGGKVTAESEASAAAGSILLEAKAGPIRILDGGEVTVRSAEGLGQDAGTLRLDSPHIEVRESSLLADASGFGGKIEIETDFLLLEKAQLQACSGGEAGCQPADADGDTGGPTTLAGGNIRIDGGAVILNQARLVADGFGNANGGRIDISADPWLRSGDSVITASSEFGLGGVVLINTPYGEVTGELAALPEVFLDASSLLEEPCLARDAPSGSFAVQRIGRLPPPPDAPLSAPPAEPQQCEPPQAP